MQTRFRPARPDPTPPDPTPPGPTPPDPARFGPRAGHGVDRQGIASRRVLRPALAWTTSVAPGLGAAGAITLVAELLGHAVPVVGAPVFAIVAGILVTVVRRPADRLRPGLSFAGRKVLQGAIVVLGLGLSLGQVVVVGEHSLPILLGSLAAALAMAWLAGRLLRVRPDVTTLVGVGTAICGASAIAATDAVIAADQADVSYSVATIFSFNVVAVLTYPSIGHLLGLSQHAFGLWAGTAINDASSVVAASTVYGHAATTYGVVVKLTRTLAIIPITLALAAWRARRAARSARAPGREEALDAVHGRASFALSRVFPYFIIGFLGAVVADTVGLVPNGWHPGISVAATWMITAALAAIGLSTDLARIRRAGARPLALGAILWATVGLVSLGLQALTGSL